MAFDLYLGKERACIEHHEEGIFSAITDDSRYPKLNRLWEEFYNGPLIQPGTANELVHELINLRTEMSNQVDSKHLVLAIDRLLPFLSKAYKSEEQIRCVSD
ncbi:hypothetical protein FLL45_13315 [Aliikangiella marina]|uniref:Uncharacterized protein n=1 Tax=Aliikangiella marina TaxID=1712262 RepID=A0A545T9F6_9GAMM|nr:hypothetical protein [Aliikangiella marina]TQV73842.1 hypothetical protein FLL45_13315 [Aliikangiella marina]